MNKHLNNWLDEREGLPPETSNNNIKKELKQQGYNNEYIVKDDNGNEIIFESVAPDKDTTINYAINDMGLTDEEAEQAYNDMFGYYQ